MVRDVKSECLGVLDRIIEREERTLAHLRRTFPHGCEVSHTIRGTIKYLREAREEIDREVPSEQHGKAEEDVRGDSS